MTDTTLEVDDVAGRALASLILTATADVIASEGEKAAEVLTKLADDTGLVLDVISGVLVATSWLAGAGGLTGEAIYAAALAFEPDDDDDDDQADDDDETDDDG